MPEKDAIKSIGYTAASIIDVKIPIRLSDFFTLWAVFFQIF